MCRLSFPRRVRAMLPGMVVSGELASRVLALCVAVAAFCPAQAADDHFGIEPVREQACATPAETKLRGSARFTASP